MKTAHTNNITNVKKPPDECEPQSLCLCVEKMKDYSSKFEVNLLLYLTSTMPTKTRRSGGISPHILILDIKRK